MNVSVVIPVYNAEKYITKAIESCLQLPDVKEIVVIDDGYKDRAKEIVKKLAELHHIIKLYEHPNNENRGAGESRNLGIQKATQEYIAFLDSDDFFLPNRFVKDSEIFRKNPNADGCYNAIGSYFYSETAEKHFREKFQNTITTVHDEANPNPENLFDGLLGIIKNYGYFSLIGFTIKRAFLQKNKLFFHKSSMHEDTVFIIKTAYFGKIYPSEISNPVTLRGVHEENRITANMHSQEKKQLHNRMLMWKELFYWSSETKIKPKSKKYILTRFQYFKLKANTEKKPLRFVVEILKNPNLLKHKEYTAFHKSYFGNLPYSSLLYKIRNFAIRFL